MRPALEKLLARAKTGVDAPFARRCRIVSHREATPMVLSVSEFEGTLQIGLATALILCLTTAVPAEDSLAQDPPQDSPNSVLSEGRALNQNTEALYYYRVEVDSAVFLRQEQPPVSNAGLTIQATTLSTISNRATERLSPSSEAGRTNKEPGYFFQIGYEGDNVIFRFTRAFNAYVLASLLAVLLIGFPLLGWVWWRLVKERRRHRKEAQLRQGLIRGQERERERLANEIHDGPIQGLYGLQLLAKGRSDYNENRFVDEITRVTEDLRSVTGGLHPPTLEEFGLGAAIQSHGDRLQNRHENLLVEISTEEKGEDLPRESALALFRITQEAMNNAAQHGNADRVEVDLKRDEEALELIVRDDGAGFEMPDSWEEFTEQGHYGLQSMRERSRGLGMEIDVESSLGDGTEVRLEGDPETLFRQEEDLKLEAGRVA